MKIEFWLIGKSDTYINTGVQEFSKRLQHYINFETILLPDVRNRAKLEVEKLKLAEGEIVLARLQASDHLILLDDKGRSVTSEQFATQINDYMVRGVKKVVFLVGGAFGFSDAVYARANEKLSLSKMTFPHQLVRLIFLEQLYRAFTIIRNEPYHHA